MREMIKLFVVVTLFSAVAGGVLAFVRNTTEAQIELQELTFVKGPAIDKILKGASNKPLQDRFKLPYEGKEINFFVGEFDGKRNTVAFEIFGKVANVLRNILIYLAGFLMLWLLPTEHLLKTVKKFFGFY